MSAGRGLFVQRNARVREPTLRLILFHHAAGSSVAFQSWIDRFPIDWEVCLVDQPGRGRNIQLPFAESTAQLVEQYRAALLPLFDRPVALFGHSMGAMVAFELARRLVETGGPAPCWVGLSAKPPGSRGTRLHQASDATLLDELRALGGTPPEVLGYRELAELIVRMARADFKLVETWPGPPPARPLPVTLSVFGGNADEHAGAATLACWRAFTTHRFALHMYPGGHFYLVQRRDELIRDLVREVRASLPACAPAAAAG